MVESGSETVRRSPRRVRRWQIVAGEAWAEIHRFSDGGLYLNFPGFGEEGEGVVRSAAGGANFDRMVALKEEYDPGNLFRFNQNKSRQQLTIVDVLPRLES